MRRITPTRPTTWTPRTGITKGNTIGYLVNQHDCGRRALKAQCCPNATHRKITRSLHEAARVSFYPAEPAAARAALALDLTSGDAGSDEANDELAAKTWLDSRIHPKATFVSDSVTPIADHRYELRGAMTIKGRTRAITAPITFTAQGHDALFEGAFVLKRADFAIGQGIWADFDTVANEVEDAMGRGVAAGTVLVLGQTGARR